MTEHEHQFPECDQDGTLVTYPCLLCGLPVGDALKLAADDRREADRRLAEKDAQIAALRERIAHLDDVFTRAAMAEKHCDNVCERTIGRAVSRYVCALPLGHEGSCEWLRETPAPPQAQEKS